MFLLLSITLIRDDPTALLPHINRDGKKQTYTNLKYPRQNNFQEPFVNILAIKNILSAIYKAKPLEARPKASDLIKGVVLTLPKSRNKHILLLKICL